MDKRINIEFIVPYSVRLGKSVVDRLERISTLWKPQLVHHKGEIMRVFIAIWLCLWQSVAANPPTRIASWPTAGRPWSLALGADSSIWVTNWDANMVQQFSTDGALLATTATPDHPAGIAVHPSGGFLIAFPTHGFVRGSALNPVSSLAMTSLEQCWGIAIDPTGRTFITEQSASRITWFSSVGSFEQAWAHTSPGDLAVGPQSSLFVLNSAECRVEHTTVGGSPIVGWGGCGDALGQFGAGPDGLGPRGLAVDPTGNVFVVDTYNHRVQVFSASGAFLIAWGSEGDGAGQFRQPTDVVVDQTGVVYVADFGNSRIEKFASPVAVSATSWSQIKQTYR